MATVKQACAWIGLPRSTYYRWKKQGLPTTPDSLVSRVQELCQKHRFRYGYRKITSQKLVTDITYLPYGNTMMYLSSILDLYNGEVVAYSIGDKQDVQFVLDTLNQLPDVNGSMLHSDQGSVYTSNEYQKAIKEKGITMSMSRKGTPADNALIESFHSTLKSETFYLENLTCTTTAIVIQTVQEYIHYYNSIRIQAKLNNQSPIEYRQLAA
ncbi:transposase [Paenibacillus sp. J53TS2]|nr:transposase [Paenibacillus sp. J53TS2]